MVTTEQTTQGAAKILDMPLKEMYNQKYFEQRWPEWFENGRFIPKREKEFFGASTAGFSHKSSHT
jgi:hypothetical protein